MANSINSNNNFFGDSKFLTIKYVTKRFHILILSIIILIKKISLYYYNTTFCVPFHVIPISNGHQSDFFFFSSHNFEYFIRKIE